MRAIVVVALLESALVWTAWSVGILEGVSAIVATYTDRR
jgi:hypothetical protein